MTIEAKILKELETALIKEKNDLEKGLAGIAKPVDKKEGDYVPSFEEIGTDRDDNATEVEQYSDNLPVELTLEAKLKNVLDALERMGQGAFGICEKCHQEIDIERLKINPSAKTCVKCKQLN
jgi:DnaK suppressor protein